MDYSTSGILLIFFVSLAAQAQAQNRDGATVFQMVCTNCHKDGGSAQAPSPDVLRRMPAQAILTALESGKIEGCRRRAESTPSVWPCPDISVWRAPIHPQSALCAAMLLSAKNAAVWNGWGIDAANSRFQSAQAAGITAADVPKLKLKWAFGFPGVTTAFGTQTVFGGRVFVGSQDGAVYSLNAQSGCIYWMYQATGGVRTGPIISSDGKTAYLSDLHAWMYAVNAETGALLWKTHVEDHPEASIAGTPKLDGGRLYIPVSGGDEELAAGNPSFVCCKMRGSIVALDAKTGKQIWKSYTISEPAKLTGKTSAGTEVWGPAGASVWSSPTIDARHHALYFGTGVNYTRPLTNTSDAVLAFDENTGHMLWSQQLLPGDVNNFGCTTDTKLNCPENPGKNVDIGSPPILQAIGGGKRVMAVATKAGMVFGLDPDQQGKILWKTMVSNGGGQGGIIWGGSSDGKNAYFSISDWNPGNPEAGGGVVALDNATGKIVWSAPAPKPACLNVKGCSQAQPGNTQPDRRGRLRRFPGRASARYSTTDGHILWDFDTNRDFETMDGEEVKIVHRNLCPESVLVGSRNEPVFVNFSLSRLPNTQTLGAVEPTDSEFDAPEVRAGGLAAATQMSDIFSLRHLCSHYLRTTRMVYLKRCGLFYFWVVPNRPSRALPCRTSKPRFELAYRRLPSRSCRLRRLPRARFHLPNTGPKASSSRFAT